MSKQKKTMPMRSLSGVVKRHPDGYGFFIPDDAQFQDVYIAKHNMTGVMSNDRVQIFMKRDGDRWRGEVKEILERKTKQVTGKIKKINRTQGILRDESYAWGEDLKVTIPPQVEMKDGDWVVVKISSYPDSMRGFQGEAEVVIGDLSSPLSDSIRVLAGHGIPFEFSREAKAEAEKFPKEVTDSDHKGRKDLRGLHLITIDGKTAKDFDDAICVEKKGKGYRLYVAIADVSYYVRPGSPIDKDAYIRGTSTYFPNFVAPMLPEALSNELCSLKPEVDRLAMVADMDFDYAGNMLGSRFYEAVMRSHARVTYGEAQEVIDNATPEKIRHVAVDIKTAAELARALLEKRFAEGSLNLEIPESTIEVDEGGMPVDIIRADRIFAHRMIEELMLAANVAVAKFISSKGIPGLFRIHESPKEDAIETLNKFLDNFGYNRPIEGSSQLQKKITRALDTFRGRAEEVVVNILTLRSMAQARYSPENVGHFGLGFSHYSHFTSPIRRYPDLIVHRLLKSCLNIAGYRKMGFDELDTAGTILSGCEQRSVKAERQIQAIKKARFMERHLGEEFDGVITSVTKFGVFVTLRQFDVDGLVKIEELSGDRFEFDEENMILIGRRSGFKYQLGDMIRVQIAAANHETGRVDFVLPKTAEQRAAGPGGTRNKANHVSNEKEKSTTKRREDENHRGGVRQIRVSGSSRKDESKSRRRSGKTSSPRHK